MIMIVHKSESTGMNNHKKHKSNARQGQELIASQRAASDSDANSKNQCPWEKERA